MSNKYGDQYSALKSYSKKMTAITSKTFLQDTTSVVFWISWLPFQERKLRFKSLFTYTCYNKEKDTLL